MGGVVNSGVPRFLDVESGLPSQIYGHHGLQHVMNYRDAIAAGFVANHEGLYGFGDRSALTIDAIGNDIWNGAAITCPIPPSAGEQMSLVSTSAQDSAAGTGMRTLRVHYLDADGNPQFEVVALDGLNPVHTVATNIRFVQHIHGASWGSSLLAAGDISIYKFGSAATVYNVITLQTNVSRNSSRMVPLGKTFFMSELDVAVADNKPIIVRIRSTSTDEQTLSDGFLYKKSFTLQNSVISKNLDVPIAFPALSIIKATAYSSSVGGLASFNWGGWLEPTN